MIVILKSLLRPTVSMARPGSQNKALKMPALGLLPLSSITLNTAPGPGHRRLFYKTWVNFLKLTHHISGTHLCPQTYSASQPPGTPAITPLPEVANFGMCVIQLVNRTDKTPSFETCYTPPRLCHLATMTSGQLFNLP